MVNNKIPSARPVLKWAGGKGQLVGQLERYLPNELHSSHIKTYIEPFVGGGAFFFYLIAKFHFKNIFLLDINPELIILYNTIKRDAIGLIENLAQLRKEYYQEQDREKYYYKRREEYNNYDKNINANSYQRDFLRRASLTVFLNKTCFNGLYRVNRYGAFNVPFGRHKNPIIFDEFNILRIASILQNAHILHADFAVMQEFCDKKSFIYYDPPYRPIKETSSFNAYSSDKFEDTEQYRLKALFDEIHQKGAWQMLSNSDPTNYGSDNFFDYLYKDYNINRILAKRMINAKGEGRKAISEILITNYDGKKTL